MKYKSVHRIKTGLRFLLQTKNVPLNAWITVLFEILPASIQKKILSKNSGTMPADLVVAVYHSCTLLQIGSF